MKESLDEVKRWAKDLRKEKPRSAEEKLGGFPSGARCLDVCRAALVGWEGEYQYGFGTDREFFTASGISQEDFREFVASGAPDCGVDKWIRLQSQARAWDAPVQVEN
jgi:Domain of unknown function (DUF5069)